jgi:hypothetical protein
MRRLQQVRALTTGQRWTERPALNSAGLPVTFIPPVD